MILQVEGLTWYPPEWVPYVAGPRVRRSTSSRPRFTDSLVVPFSGQAEIGWVGGVEGESLKFLGKPNGYTSENKHGTQKWRFWRWFSFSKRWFSGSMLIFWGVHTRKRNMTMEKTTLWRCTVYSIRNWVDVLYVLLKLGWFSIAMLVCWRVNPVHNWIV